MNIRIKSTLIATICLAAILYSSISVRSKRSVDFTIEPGYDHEESAAHLSKPRSVITICSQNLERFQLSLPLTVQESKKVAGLVERFRSTDCDVIAVQEVMVNAERSAVESLTVLSSELSKQRPGSEFRYYIGEGSDQFITSAVLLDEKRFAGIEEQRIVRCELPALNPTGKPDRCLRNPQILSFKPSNSTVPFSLINIHFKSKRSAAGSRDPLQLKFETQRMQMAELVNDLATQDEGICTIVLGDRNGPPEAAASQILNGDLDLADFQRRGTELPSCTVSKGGLPLCAGKTVAEERQRLTSMITLAPYFNPENFGSFTYKKKIEWIDDIQGSVGCFKGGAEMTVVGSGVVTEPGASDHGLVYVKVTT